MKSAQEAVTVTGVVPDHVDPLLRVARELNAFILIRPVNLQATGLIKANFDTKDLHCKGKSSDWGPQAGFICVDQSLSKKANADDVVKNALVEKPHAHIAEVPLVLPKVRLEELVRLKMFKTVPQRGGTWDRVVSAVPNEPGKPERYFGLGEISNPEKLSSAHIGRQLEETHRTWLSKLPAQYPPGTPCYPVYELASADNHSEENAKVVMVAANNDAKKVPLTADYDVLALCPALSNYASTYKLLTENLKTPQQAVDSALKKAGVTEEQIKAVRKLAVARRWKALANTIRTGLGQFDAGRSRKARELTWSYVLQKRKVAEAGKNQKSAEELAELKALEHELLE